MGSRIDFQIEFFTFFSDEWMRKKQFVTRKTPVLFCSERITLKAVARLSRATVNNDL